MEAAESTGVSVFDWVNLGLAVIGIVLSVGSLIFAYLAASRSDRLLKRLVVEPFRDLDTVYGKLTQAERTLLLQVFSSQRGAGKGISANRQPSDDLLPQDANALEFLREQDWLQQIDPPIINPDRIPYLTFIRESEGR
jgi:hypothetical protein